MFFHMKSVCLCFISLFMLSGCTFRNDSDPMLNELARMQHHAASSIDTPNPSKIRVLNGEIHLSIPNQPR